MRTSIAVSTEIRDRLEKIRDIEGLKSVNDVLETFLPDPAFYTDEIARRIGTQRKEKRAGSSRQHTGHSLPES